MNFEESTTSVPRIMSESVSISGSSSTSSSYSSSSYASYDTVTAKQLERARAGVLSKVSQELLSVKNPTDVLSYGRWWLFGKTLVCVGVVVVLRCILRFALHYNGSTNPSYITPFVAGSYFIIGFMLKGVLEDYKEAEKLPLDLGTLLDNYQEEWAVLARHEPLLNKWMKLVDHLLLDMIEGIRLEDHNIGKVMSKLNQLRYVHQTVMDMYGASGIPLKLFVDYQKLRHKLLRMKVIVDTDYLPVGYSFINAIILANVVVLLTCKFEDAVSEFTLTPAVSFVFFFLYLIIWDADDPFDYREKCIHGSVEIPMDPLFNVRDRFVQRERQARSNFLEHHHHHNHPHHPSSHVRRRNLEAAAELAESMAQAQQSPQPQSGMSLGTGTAAAAAAAAAAASSTAVSSRSVASSRAAIRERGKRAMSLVIPPPPGAADA